MNQSQSGLKKELKTRHMTMISIAGVIGAGLFVGSGSVIHSTGPGAVVSYALAGLLVIFIMRMLGEMSAVNPTSGSFLIRSRRHRTVGRIYNRLAVLVFLGDRHSDRSHCRCWHYSILVP